MVRMRVLKEEHATTYKYGNADHTIRVDYKIILVQIANKLKGTNSHC